MAVIIHELQITASVGDSSVAPAGLPAAAQPAGTDDKDTLMAEFIEQTMEVIRNKNER